MNVADKVFEHARQFLDKPAIQDQNSTICYGELASLIQRSAIHLNHIGIRQGDVVGVCLKDTIAHLVLLYAIAKMGAVILPMDWRWTSQERQRIASFFQAKAILYEPGDSVAPGIPAIMLDAAWQRAVAMTDGEREFATDTSTPVALSLSSGTTGIPKGPMINHGHLEARFLTQQKSLSFGPDDRYLSATPLYYGAGRQFAMGFLYHGGSVIMYPPPFEPAALVEAVKRHQVSILLLVPTLLRQLLLLPTAGKPLLDSLRLLFSTGAILHSDERRAVLEQLSPNTINYYGSTEGGGISILRPQHRGTAERSVGKPVDGVQVQVVDENGTEVPVGGVGHFRFRGPGVADGFYLNPDASSETFVDGWFYPGDLARIDSDGFIYLLGRTKDVINRGGVNVYPEEIERVLLAHRSVRDTAVVGWPDQDKGEEIAAFVVADSEIRESDLLQHCGNQLAAYKVPKAVFFVADLPKNNFGKVRKPELVTRLPQHPQRS